MQIALIAVVAVLFLAFAAMVGVIAAAGLWFIAVPQLVLGLAVGYFVTRFALRIAY